MKHLLTLIFTLLIILGYSQCNNGTNYYPSTIYTPSDNAWGSATSWNYAGEIIRVNIIAGDDYEFSTCSGYGGVNASYDTQLTLVDELGAVIDFNDDFTGCTGYTSYVKYTATYTGILEVHLNEYNCATNTSSTEVMIYKTPAPSGGGGGNTNEVTIGDPNSTLQNGRVPAYGYYDYSWSASIYTAAELSGVPLNIEKISWNVANSSSMTLNNQEIWMAMTPEEIFNDGTMPDVGNGPWDQWKKVYDGTLSFVPGWNEINLQGLYGYDGVQNLLVKVINNHGSWASSYPEFQYTAKTNSVVYNYEDGGPPSPVGFRNSYRPNTIFGHQGGGSALPIDLISFNAEYLGSEIHPIVMINWITLSQVNNDYFEVQRSVDVENWYTVETVTGAGNNNSQMSYSVIDTKPFYGTSYYRLKQTDYDGQHESFHPVSVSISSEEKIVNKVINFMGQEVNEYYKGMVLEIYQDGTYVKKYYK
jgi:hypothetical protein